MSITGKLALRQLHLNRRRTAITLIGIILSVSMITAVAGFSASVQDMMRNLFVSTYGDWHIVITNVTDKQAKDILNDPLVESGFVRSAKESDGSTTTAGSYTKAPGVYFRLANPTNKYDDIAKQIAAKHGIDLSKAEPTEGGVAYDGGQTAITPANPQLDFNKSLLGVEGHVAGEGWRIMLYSVMGILIFVIVFGSVMVISNAFTISASERLKQFGILKSTGATKRQISSSVRAEGLVLSAIGIPIGIAVGFAVEAALLLIANNYMTDLNDLFAASVEGANIHFNVVFSWQAVAIAAAVSFMTIMVSAWLPARRAARTSAIDAIRMSGEIKISPKKMRTPRFITKMFGFEGALAAKSLKRSRRAYRATVASLVVGIVLYLLASGFGGALSKAIDITFPDTDTNVMANAYNLGSWKNAEKLNKAMLDVAARTKTDKLIAVRSIFIPANITPDMLGKDLDKKEFADDRDYILQFQNVKAIVLDDKTLDEYCRKAGVDKSALADGGALLMNRYKALDARGNTVEVAPFVYEKDRTIEVNGEKKSKQLTLRGEVTDVPPWLAYSQDTGEFMNLIVSEKTFKNLADIAGEAADINAQWHAQASDAATLAKAWQNTVPNGEPNGDSYGNTMNGFVQDNARNAAAVRSIVALGMIFIYCFIAMLSLIGVTSVIGAISTNIRLRAQEFAMLSSVGMTPQARRRMLNLESLFYGIRALFIGIPIGLLLSWAMYEIIGSKIGFSFIVPWESIAVCIVAVFLLTFATMRYSANRLRGMNIVETLKDVNL